MRTFLQSGVLLGLICSTICSQADTRVVYKINPARSEFVVQLFKAGVGAALAHDHVVQATAYEGQIQVDPAAPTTASIAVEVQAASLEADEPALRQKYGLTTQLSEKERQEIRATMLSQRQLDVARYPTMMFTSIRVEQQTDGVYAVMGELTIRGVTRSVLFPARAEVRDDAVHAWGSFRFLQSSFGYEPYSAFLGAVRNQDAVVLRFDVIAAP